MRLFISFLCVLFLAAASEAQYISRDLNPRVTHLEEAISGSNGLPAEIARATLAENTIQSNLVAETDRAIAAEGLVQSNLDSFISSLSGTSNTVEIYIDFSQGSDSTNAKGSIARPYKTLAYACAQFQTQSANWDEYNTPMILHVAGGTYEDDVVFPRRNCVTLMADGFVYLNGNIDVNKSALDYHHTAGSGRQSPVTIFKGPGTTHYVGKGGLQINGDLTFRPTDIIGGNDFYGGTWQIVFNGVAVHGCITYAGATNYGMGPTVVYAGSDISDENRVYNILATNRVQVTAYNHGLIAGNLVTIGGSLGCNVTNWPVETVIDRHNFTYITPYTIPISYFNPALDPTNWYSPRTCSASSPTGTLSKYVWFNNTNGAMSVIAFDCKLTKRVFGNMKIIEIHDCRIGNIDYSSDPFGANTNYSIYGLSADAAGAYISGFKNCTFEGTVYKFGSYTYSASKYPIGFDAVSWVRMKPKNPVFTNLVGNGYTLLDRAFAVGFTNRPGMALSSNVQDAIVDVYNRTTGSVVSITNHSELAQLDYASAGHTGFQPAGDYMTNGAVISHTNLANVNDDPNVQHLTALQVSQLSSLAASTSAKRAEVEAKLQLPYTVLHTNTDPTSLAITVQALSNNAILEVDSSATYYPITIPTNKTLVIRSVIGKMINLTGTNCIRLMNGTRDTIIAGVSIQNCTTLDNNAQGAGISLEHYGIVSNVSFHCVSIDTVLFGSGVMLSYHQSTGGDNYATPNTLGECSVGINFFDCCFYKANKDNTEGAALSLRGVTDAIIDGCHFRDDALAMRQIQLQNCIGAYVHGCNIRNTATLGSNSEGIKLDDLGGCTFRTTGYIVGNTIKNAVEGIDLDDNTTTVTYDNICYECTEEGISVDDSAVAVVGRNLCYNNRYSTNSAGIYVETNAVVTLLENTTVNNQINYRIANGYVLPAGNTTNIQDIILKDSSRNLVYGGSIPNSYDVHAALETLYGLGTNLQAQVGTETTNRITADALLQSQIDVISPLTYYVSTAGNDGNAGTNWATSLATISNAVARCISGDTVLVSNGTYLLTAPIVIDKKITLQGLNGRDYTVIDGNSSVTNIRCFFVTGENVIIEGLTISNAFVVDDFSHGGGGGIRAEGSNILVKDCRITKNVCSNSVVGYHSMGGGIMLYSSGARIEDSIIEYNESRHRDASNCYAGGIMFDYIGVTVPAVITNCIIRNNITDGWGGGVNILNDGTIQNSVIYSNVAGRGVNDNNGSGGGVYIKWAGLVDTCDIFNNRATNLSTASGYGGGIASWNGTVRNCNVYSNYANRGAGIAGFDGGLIENCNVYGNNSMYSWAGIYWEVNNIAFTNDATVRNCLIKDNTANVVGGGIVLQHYGINATHFSWMKMQNCTVVENNSLSSTANSPAGASIYTLNSNVAVYAENCIIVSNYVKGTNWNTSDLNTSKITNSWIYNCIIGGSNTSHKGSNIFYVNPRFYDFAAKDYSLMRDSPAIDSGLLLSWQSSDLDIIGNKRIWNKIVDLGAYEYVDETDPRYFSERSLYMKKVADSDLDMGTNTLTLGGETRTNWPTVSSIGSGESGQQQLSTTGTNEVIFSQAYSTVPHVFIQLFTGSTYQITFDVIVETLTNAMFLARNASGLETDSSIAVSWATAGSIGSANYSNWSKFKAIQDVDMDGHSILNVGINSITYTDGSKALRDKIQTAEYSDSVGELHALTFFMANGSITNPYYTLFLTGEKTNGSQNIIDNSPLMVPATPFAAFDLPTVSTQFSKFGKGSLFFNNYKSGKTNAVAFYSENAYISKAPWTFHCWLLMTNASVTSGYFPLIGKGYAHGPDTTNGDWQILLRLDPTGSPTECRPVFVFNLDENNYFLGNTGVNAFTANTWHHVAVVLEALSGTSKKLSLYVDGVLNKSETDTQAWSSTNENGRVLHVGVGYTEGSVFTAGSENFYLDDIVFVQGQALWTGAFTPPTTSITNSRLFYADPNGGVFQINGTKQ